VPGPPNDPLFRVQWNLPMIGIPAAWSVTRGSGVTVAVIDTGVAYEDYGAHRRAPDLAGTKFVPGWDFIKNDSHPDDEALPGQPSHGTAIAGVIAQTTGNGIGGAGIAPDAAIMPIRVLDPNGAGANTAVAKGLRFAADHGANVANLSLGGDVQSQEVADAVAYAVAKGVTVVASAGDEGQPSISYPAAYPAVIAVGAVRYDTTRAPYSSYGPRLDLVAPGGDLSVDQNHDGVEDGIVQQTLFGSPSTFCFCFKQGTSSAAAHVSAVAALVIASGRATTPAAVRAVLTTTAEHLGPPGHNDEYGFGLVQAASALGIDAGTQSPAAETTTPTTAALSAPSTLAALGPDTTAAHPGGRLVTSRSRAGWVSLVVAGGLCALVALAILRRRARAPGGRPPDFSDGGPGAGNP
jgi:serine protease